MKISAIITAAGKGNRCNLHYNKLLFDIGGGITLLEKTISNFLRDDISSIYVTASDVDYPVYVHLFSKYDAPIHVVKGGNTRQQSVRNALNMIDDADFVVIHDGARPFVSQQIIDDALNLATTKGNATVSIDCIDSLREISSLGSRAVTRECYACVQTPQIFDFKTILRCHNKAHELNLTFSDDASLFEYFGNTVYLSKGSTSNIKITTKDHLNIFTPHDMYVGHGWDTHMLTENRKLILGGIQIPHTKGLLGHSDADVLIHAIMDALLSASHNKDIGQLFPDNDNSFKDISSLILLKKVDTLLKNDGYEIGNISCVIMAQKPKLANFIPLMQKTIAHTLEIDQSKITISATTTEKLGLCGHEEAISCSAYCLLKK